MLLNSELERYLLNLGEALDSIFLNKVRSLLTALGIVFGVASLISMLAIGRGTEQELLQQMKLIGVNNIVVEPIVDQQEVAIEEDATRLEQKKFSPGLTMADAESIRSIIPGILNISPEIVLDTYVIKSGIRRSAKLVGVLPSHFKVANFKFSRGNTFNSDQLHRGAPVCIIGKAIRTKFFSQEDPIGKYIKCGPHWLKIVGVLEERLINQQTISNLGIRDYNLDVYCPLQTFLMRYKNRSLITKAQIEGGDNDQQAEKQPNYHQIDRILVQVESTEKLNPISEILSRLLQRRHNDVVDFQVQIPELLLKQQQKTKSIFNIVLGAIAGISLLVGGIGIMNIMLASVLERIKEIGIRLAVGATKADIVSQFLFEAVLIGVTGGIIGVLLGLFISKSVSILADIPVIVTPSSITFAFGVAVSVGLIFGIAPARKAASQNPIKSLRHE